jgi:flagellar biosynthesis/type III secretory pathway protein FliH
VARGKWTTSYRDKARAQYAADQIAQVTASQLDEVRRQAWQEGYNAGFVAGAQSAQQQQHFGRQQHHGGRQVS